MLTPELRRLSYIDVREASLASFLPLAKGAILTA